MVVSLVPFVTADLVGVMLETGLYGGYCVLFALCLYTIIYKPKYPIHPLLSVTAVSSFVLTTTYIALDQRRMWLNWKVDPRNPAMAVYVAEHQVILGYVIGCVLVANSIIADGVLIWRCFSVYDRNLWVCIPSLSLLIGGGVSGFSSVYYRQHDSSSIIDEAKDAQWSKGFLAISIATNVLTTGLIAGRIWYLKKRIQRAFSGSKIAKRTEYYDTVLALIIDTGGIYTLALTAELILYILNLDAPLIILLSMISQITGIVPTMIIVYSALGNRIELTSIHTEASADIPTTYTLDFPSSGNYDNHAPSRDPMDIGPYGVMAQRNSADASHMPQDTDGGLEGSSTHGGMEIGLGRDVEKQTDWAAPSLHEEHMHEITIHHPPPSPHLRFSVLDPLSSPLTWQDAPRSKTERGPDVVRDG